MIPVRVKLKGFLCYKEEQEVSFDGSTLWMLSGLNGSGKSAIFDVVTYALFGHHRGGSQRVDELINKNSDNLEVEFEFLQEGRAYRIRRTAKRTAKGSSSSQQIYQRLVGNGDGQGKWEAIEDTSNRRDFEKWIQNNIGLNYETFTSSVLLLQGKAEKLLGAVPRERFDVLAGIVDLERYQHLHQKADDQRKSQDAVVRSLRDRLAAIPEISPLELIEVEAHVQEAEKEREQARTELERLQVLEFQARQWQDVQNKLTQTRQRLTQTESLLAEAGKIEHAEQRLKELRQVLPLVENALAQQRTIEEAERRLGELNKQREKLEQDGARLEEETQKTRHKRGQFESDLQRQEARLRELSNQLREMTVQLEKLRLYERQEQELSQLRHEMQTLPADPAADVKQAREAREAHEQLALLAQLVPQLTRFAEVRHELRETLQREKIAAETRQKIEAQGKKLKAELEQLKVRLTETQQARRAADEQATRTSTLLESARRDLDDLLQIGGAKVCRHCGQELTSSHIVAEKVRREKELHQAEQQQQQAAQQQRTVMQQEKQLRVEVEALEQQTQKAREDYLAQKQEADQARKDMERLHGECLQTYQHLPEPFRHKISVELPTDWLQTSYPTAETLAELRRQAQGLDRARQRLREAELVAQKWQQVKTQENTLLQTLQRLQAELPKNHDELRTRHGNHLAEEKALEKELAAKKTSLTENQKELDRLARQREQLQAALAKCRAEVQTQTAAQHGARTTRTRILKDLPESWLEPVQSAGLADIHGWQHERDTLIEQKTEQRVKELQQARLTSAGLQQEVADLEAQLLQFPAEAQQGPSHAQQIAAAARQRYQHCDAALTQARQKFTLLDNQHRQREQVQQEYLAADKTLAHCKLLAELLGRERLQLHLVRQAERQVVDHANAVLDRLSGGELYLRLTGEAGGEGNSVKALELEAHNRITGEKPINVAFLSGSQKFRVAVSLALGIGQYASRQHRPIEAVIIDEGFGCLDRNARQVMIQELQNLRSQMRCILLVSHQEEFADAFTDGYHFELHNGSTVARRFQR